MADSLRRITQVPVPLLCSWLALLVCLVGCEHEAAQATGQSGAGPARKAKAANFTEGTSGKALPAASKALVQEKPPLEFPTIPPQPVEAPILTAGAPLVAAAPESPLPEIGAGKVAAAGIRKLSGKHVSIYTDLPAGEVDELPAVFDAAVPLWCEYFGVAADQAADWHVVASVMKDKERFVGAGLYDETLPPFPHGFSRGSQLWLYDQPSGYYRRHLLLHEGTHGFMTRWLGGAGPPWYMEGIAELLATHRWAGGKLALGVMPRSKEEVPYWGRVKIIRDEYAAGRGMTLAQIIAYDRRAHLRNEPYGWCWGAAAFFDAHPLTQTAFRELKREAADRNDRFSEKFAQRIKADWDAIAEDWQLFVLNCDYGYDFARAAVVHRPGGALPAGGGTVKIAADRGWQSSGFKLEAGKAYTITASGRYEVAREPKPWPCEPQGVTIRYHRGRPLGMLLAAVKEDAAAAPLTPLATPLPIGRSAEITPETSGTLYLSINEAASGLADNSGTIEVQVRQH